MGLPYLTINKCCCLKLPTVGIVIGVLGIIFSLLKTLECWANLNKLKKFGDSETDAHYQYHYERVVSDVVYYELIPSIAYTLSSILVIIGIKKNSHLMLIPWLLVNVVVLIFCLPPVIVFFFFAGFRGSSIETLTVIAVLFLFITAFFWMWIIIFSLFESMRIKRNLSLATNQKTLTSPPRYEAVHYNNV